MADNRQDDDELDLGKETNPGKKKLILIIGVLFLLINVAVGAYIFLFSGDDKPGENGEEVVEELSDEDLGPTFYHAFKPDFVVNLESAPSLLQVGLQVRIRGEEMVEFLKYNDPMIRHQFLALLGVQDGKQLKKRAEKEKLQHALLLELRRIVTELSGPDPERGIEDIYFVSFVTQ